MLLDGNGQNIEPVKDFLIHQQATKSENTVLANARDMCLYWNFLEATGISWERYDLEMVARFVRYLQGSSSDTVPEKSQRSEITIKRILYTVYYFHEFTARKRGNPPPKRIKPSKIPGIKDGQPEKRTGRVVVSHYVTKKEFKTLLSKLEKPRDILIYNLIYQTGAKMQDLLNLQISQVPEPDPEAPYGVIRLSYYGKKLYVPSNLLQQIHRYIRTDRSRFEPGHEYLFVSEKTDYAGIPLTDGAAYSMLKYTLKQMDANFSVHDLRQTVQVNMIESGIPRNVAMYLLGRCEAPAEISVGKRAEAKLRSYLVRYWKKYPCPVTGKEP